MTRALIRILAVVFVSMYLGQAMLASGQHQYQSDTIVFSTYFEVDSNVVLVGGGQLEAGKRIGPWTYTFMGTEITAKSVEYDAEGHTLCTRYFYPSGIRLSIDSIANDTLHLYVYFSETGMILNRTDDSPSILECSSYFDSGALASHYRRAKRNSSQPYQVVRYYETGRVKEQFTMVGDSMNGKYSKYRTDGSLMYTCEYSAGVLNGLWQEFDSQGMITHVSVFVNGSESP